MHYGLENRQTIFALATGLGKAAIAIFRISGPGCRAVLEQMIGSVPIPRQAVLRKLRRPTDGAVLDQILALWFPAPHSYTGEDFAELHCHGSPAVIKAVSAALGQFTDLRLAQPGEFSRRALLNGKMDLTAIEALGDLLEAQTEGQRQLAVSQMSGQLRQQAEFFRAQLIRALVLLESVLDFSDEADAPKEILDDTLEICAHVSREIDQLLLHGGRGEILRDGLTVLLSGVPNVGKSTLLNALARRDVAIVSQEPGTTRDLIETYLDLDGYPLLLIDSAGIRTSPGVIEAEGIARAKKRAASADLILWLCATESDLTDIPTDYDSIPLWIVQTKLDITNAPLEKVDLALSAKTNVNMDVLIDQLKTFAIKTIQAHPDHILLSRERHRIALREAQEALCRAQYPGLPMELLAEEIRHACYALESLIGKVGVENVLDELFSSFCIGK